MKENDESVLPRTVVATPPDLPKGLQARLWIDSWCFFSSGRADDSCWLWLLRADGRVQAVRLSNANHGRDDLLVPLMAYLDTRPERPLRDNDSLGSVWLLQSAPVVPVTRWAISWGHPQNTAIRQFAGLLDHAVLDALGRLEVPVPGPFFGSAGNYNRLADLPAETRGNRLQALALFPPLAAPLLLDGYDKPDMFSDNGYSEVIPARFLPTDEAPVLDAMDRGRDLIGALARYWRVDRSLVRAPLSRVPWRCGRIDDSLLQLLNAIPAHRRPGTRDEVERFQFDYDELPVHPRTRRDRERLAGVFTPDWVAAWRRLHEAFPALPNQLRDCRDFLRSALVQVDWVDLPAWLDMDTLALSWLARRGANSLLASSQRWHNQPLRETPADPGLPRQLTPLLGQIETDDGSATELTTPESLRDEGEAMHHCVGEYWNDCLFGPNRIVHLELAEGETATAQYDSSHDPADPRFELVELRGRFNESGSRAMQAFAETIADRLNGPALGDKRVEILNEANRLRSGVDWSQAQQTTRPLDRRTRAELRLVIDYCLKQPDWRARDDIVYRGVIAGFGHAGGLLLINQIHVGDELELVREPANPHDALAVRIDWLSHKIGYVPRRNNHDIARMLDAGDPLEAAIDRIRHDGSFAPVDCVIRMRRF